MLSRGRPVDWEIPQVNPKVKKNLIWAELPNGKPIPVKAVARDGEGGVFDFVLPSEVKAGEKVTIFVGSPLKGQGSRSQTNTQRRRPFHLYIDPKGKGDVREHEAFHVDVKGGPLESIRIMAPSVVARNKRFDVVVRFEDAYGNLTNHAIEGTLMDLSYENLRENLNWKLFVPETGFLSLPNLYFNEPGVYKIQLKNTKTAETFFSPPIKCLPEAQHLLYWGLLHGESEKFDATDNIESCLRVFRDEQGLQFYGISSPEDASETSNEAWKKIGEQIAEFDEDHRFVIFSGFQYLGDEAGEGLRQIVYLKDGKPILRKKESKTGSFKKLTKIVNPKETIAVPMFSMAKKCPTDFSAFDPDLEKVVEIYNAWGSSEMSAKEGNRYPIEAKSKGAGTSSTDAGSVLAALKKNHRFGFVAGGLDDRGVFSEFFEAGQEQYSPGLTAILAPEQTKEALFRALQTRSSYATTGAKIIVGFSIAGTPIGGELSTRSKPGLVINRHIVGYVAGTSDLKEIAIVRNGVVVKRFDPKAYFFDFAWDDMEPLGKIALSSSGGKPPFVFYYLRVLQTDGHMAWSSPIWVDHPEGTTVEGKPEKKTATKRVS
jgi:hypothetical protein